METVTGGIVGVMASRKRIYDAGFREGAVRIVTETGKPIPEVAEDLGIHPGTLHSWVSRARRNGSPSSDRPVAEPSPGGRLRESERSELERLRAEAREKDKRIRTDSRRRRPAAASPPPIRISHTPRDTATAPSPSGTSPRFTLTSRSQ